MQQYGGIRITPIVTRASPGFVILFFLSTSDARHFEGTVSRKKKNIEIPDLICTQRWAVSSSALAGDEESIFYIQNEVVNYYNDHMERMGLEQFQLQQHHIRMIRINTSQKFVKGKPQVLFDFLDPCDRLSCLLWYQGTDPFRDHDFSLAIPNQKTRAKIASNAEYAKYTLEDKGLWTVKPRTRGYDR